MNCSLEREIGFVGKTTDSKTSSCVGGGFVEMTMGGRKRCPYDLYGENGREEVEL